MRFGLVGTGFWADAAHASGLAAHSGVDFVGVWGRDVTKAEGLARKHGVHAFVDLDELIDSVDALAFAVPPDVQGELAVRAAARGRALLLDKPLAFDVAAAERIAEAARAPSAVFFTARFDPAVAAWFEANIDGRRWDGASARFLLSIFEPPTPFAASSWRRERGALWDVAPHVLALILPVLGAVTGVGAVRGPRDEVHITLAHVSGAVSSVAVSLSSAANSTEALFWGGEGLVRVPTDVDLPRAYAAAVDAVLGRPTPFDVRFGLEVVRVLAAVEQRLA